MKLLVVIPARGGSKRIPRKNVRLMCGLPLVLYSVYNAASLSGEYDCDVVVSTDDEELEYIVQNECTMVIRRGEELSGDEVTLDPVIYDALIKAEEAKGCKYDVVITMQATSPTLKRETLSAAVRFFLEGGFDTVISVVNKPHLSWKKDEEGNIVKNYDERLNSQLLPANFLETGGFVISGRDSVTERSRIGEKISVFEVSPAEAVDIDSDDDWIAAEAILKRRKILFRLVGQRVLGTGHIYRCLSLAARLIGNEVLLVTDEASDIGIEKLRESNFPFEIVKDEGAFEEILKRFRPDVVVNDVLNTSREFVRMERKYTSRIVNFEDEGEGAAEADAVINALYEHHINKLSNVYEGPDYYFIRDEFLIEQPGEFSEKCRNVLILFGGSDPSDLTGRLYEICQVLHDKKKEAAFHFLTGIGYAHKDKIVSIPSKNIFVHHDAKRVSRYMKEADLAITSQGRTIYELASMGVPAIVLAQNEREAEHVFAGIRNGFINLGIGSRTDAITIIQTIQWLMNTPNVRREMRNIELTKEFARGQKRVIDLILGD
ncbi:MAG: UDP-2,4-diacetamido-2,4,6-trideoxy-beta-L-altropyranose hydrolase [Lachnospiraceae bacterium]|nr:UDP-2,4-diacetamido-2,4,6-trideoxy-beta-L-altropyranose hydrolase [Lachnospiraceae bacterium]